MMKSTRIIELAPTFKLLNLFLVGLAQKFITQLDLDSLFTEYYKERLELQLTNKKIYTTDHKSTKLTKLTGLQLFINSTSYQTLSFAKLFPLTPLLLSLSLPLFNNFAVSLVSSHNLFCLHLNSKCNKPSYHFVVILLSIDKIESFSKPKGKKK